MKNQNKELIKTIRRLTNLVIILAIAIIVLPIIVLNIDDISAKFETFDKEVEVKPYDASSATDALLAKARKSFKSITLHTASSYPEAVIALGKSLYFENQLSLDGNISCNSCHNLDTYGVDNLPTSPGDKGGFGDRNSPTTIYAALHTSQFWDGRAKDVEEQSGMPILNPVEHNIPSKSFLENRLRDMDKYKVLFAEAFPNEQQPITYDNLQYAIGAFERQLLPKSRFDRWLDGNDEMLNEQEVEGLRIFMDNQCTTCHSGVSLGGSMLQKFGVYDDYWNYTKSKHIDEGLYAQTGNEQDKYVFKVPGLRNIAKTSPYFHDGSVDNLEDAVKIMARTQVNKVLSDKEANQIVVFLESLTADVEARYKN